MALNIKRKKKGKNEIPAAENKTEDEDFLSPRKVKKTGGKHKTAKGTETSDGPVSGNGDAHWELAVAKARGLPDGGMSGSSDGSEMDMDVQEADSGVEDTTRQTSNTKKGKPGKEKTKSKNVISKAAEKFKRAKNKPSENENGKNRKRKSDEEKSGEKAADDGKKVKAEDMKAKDRKKLRKQMRTNYVLSHEAKKLWEDLRRMNLSSDKRYQTSADLHKLIKGKAKELIFAHDTSRVIQCLMKYGAQEHKDALFEELKGEIVVMAKSKYAKFFVRKLLKYGTKEQRKPVFESLYGNVKRLIKHKEAAEIIECAYNDYANAEERAGLIEDFYGPSFALFKTKNLKTLEQVIESHQDKKESILTNMKEALTALVQKSVLQFSIVHKVFMDYFNHCNEKQRGEMIEVVREGVIHMLHTRDGARVAMICLWYGTAKDRKILIKSMKSYVCKICKEEYGHMVLLSLFDVVDDTKIVQKIILEELLKSVHEVSQDQYGRKVLLYLLSPRDPKHFHPDVLSVLQQGDGNPHSKKESSLRRSELLEAVSRPLVQYIVKHSEELVLSNPALLLILSVLTHVKSDPTDAMVAVAKIAAKPFVTTKESSESHIVEHPGGHMTMKRLILNDAERIKAGSKVLFSGILMDILHKGALRSWTTCNRGCFLIVFLLEVEDNDVKEKVLHEISGLQDSLKQLDFKGAQILLKKLKEV